MPKIVYEFVPKITFREQTPEVFIETKKPDPLYEKAFLSRESETEGEFKRNTTTWD